MQRKDGEQVGKEGWRAGWKGRMVRREKEGKQGLRRAVRRER